MLLGALCPAAGLPASELSPMASAAAPTRQEEESMPKIAFIGAGSMVFSRQLMTDILHFPALEDTEFCLMDINPQRLDLSRRMGQRIIAEQKSPARVTTTTNRTEAIKDADFVIIMILSQGFEPIQVEYDIPVKHGVDHCIGDTLGSAGVFRFLRTMTSMEEICDDVVTHANENCLILNYTNPMAMLTWACHALHPGINLVGLCHSVQWTTELLAKWIEVPCDQIRYQVAGINHQAWVLEYKMIDGTDLYPKIRQTLPTHAVYNTTESSGETVRIEMMKHLGYFVTESSGHNSEYNPWFRKRDDLIKKYTGPEYSGAPGYIVDAYGPYREKELKAFEAELEQKENVKFKRSYEYGSFIINAICTNEPLRMYGNVPNAGLITNLLHNCCVEVPCLVDGTGLSPCHVGDLPPQCAALNRTNVSVQELAVKAYMEKSREAVYHSCYHDPLTAAKLSLAEIAAMVDEFFEVETAKGWLPQMK
jgi:alpha-galactosidase